MGIFKKIIAWFKESNRYKHFYIGFLLGLTLTVLCAIGAGSGAEFKDKAYGNNWDWIDWWCTTVGGILGQIVQLLIIWLIL